MTNHTTPDPSTTGTIVVIGGTGKTGRRVVDRLVSAGHATRSSSRSTTPAFDWNDPQTWDASLAGASAVYITYYPDLAFPGVSDLIGEFARKAVAHGAQRLVLLSGRGEEGAEASEQQVRDAGVEWTIVRCSWFNQNFSEDFFLESVQAGEIVVPAGDDVEPFVDADDIADVVVAALTEPGHSGQVYELAGPRLLSFFDVADELSRATGRDIRYVPVSHEEYAAILAEYGMPAEFGELFSKILDGRNAHLTDGVRRALGREPRDFADYAADAARTGVWNALQPAR
jgi:uncharacterized protein YbjT (DUF2867 family)